MKTWASLEVTVANTLIITTFIIVIVIVTVSKNKPHFLSYA